MISNEIKYDFPFDITPVDSKTNTELLNYFHGERTSFVQVGPEKYLYPIKYKENASSLYNFQARPDDIWISTFPRSGTTWTQELIWLISNNLDFETARTESLMSRFPFIDGFILWHDDVKKELSIECEDDSQQIDLFEKKSKPIYDFLNQIQGQRFIKTHLAFSLMSPSVMEQKCKVIYVARHPKDVAVSYYHFNRLVRVLGYVGDFPRYWDYFEKGLTVNSPYWSHVKEGWANRHHSNVLFLFYEELSQNLSVAIRKVADFLGKSLTDNQVDGLVNFLQFDNFKNNHASISKRLNNNRMTSGETDFIRKGSYIGWQSEYTPELRKRAEKWIDDNLKDTDLRFPE